MSRGRFFYVEAIGRVVPTETWGNGFPGYDSEKSVSDNLLTRPPYDVVFAYKPEDHIGFGDVDALRVLDINEMYNRDRMCKMFCETKPHVAICHHANEMAPYVPKFPECRFVHIPHCSDPNYFHEYRGVKKTDVLLIGRLSSERYPLRTRMATEVIPALCDMGFSAKVWQHPGYDIDNADSNDTVIQYAKAIAASKIVMFCSGTPKSRYAKYNEAALCGTAIAADIPGEDEAFFRQFVIEIPVDMPSDAIADKVAAALRDEDGLRERSKRGREMSKHLTTSYYAKHAVDAFREAIKARHPLPQPTPP